MSFENRHIFKGNIEGKNLYNYIGLDYKVKDLETRKKKVDDILNESIDEYGRSFFEIYLDEYFKSEVSQCDELSEKNNVCRTLEAMANYLLGSEEIREERRNDTQNYKFYINKEEFNLRTKKEDLLNGMVPECTDNNSNNNSHDNVMHFLLSNKKNSKKVKVQGITNADLKEDTTCGQVLRDYNSLYKAVSDSLLNPNEFKGKRYKLTKLKKDLFYDMIYCKDHLKGVFGYKLKSPLIESTQPDWSLFDWYNSTHVRELIYLQNEFSPEDEISFLIMDLELLIKKMLSDKALTNKEMAAYKLIRRGYKNVEIAKVLNVNKSRVSLLVNSIVDKICMAAKKYKY